MHDVFRWFSSLVLLSSYRAFRCIRFHADGVCLYFAYQYPSAKERGGRERKKNADAVRTSIPHSPFPAASEGPRRSSQLCIKERSIRVAISRVSVTRVANMHAQGCTVDGVLKLVNGSRLIAPR